MSDRPALVWFRQDLRLEDNPAVLAACRSGAPVAALFVLDDENAGDWRPGGASRWWLHGSLMALSEMLAQHDVRLILRRGPADEIVPQVASTLCACGVYWNRCYEPYAIARDKRLKSSLRACGLIVESHNAALIAEPWDVRTGGGGPYRVFTPFWKSLRDRHAPPTPQGAPTQIIAHQQQIGSDNLENWGLRPLSPDWATGFGDWVRGANGARRRLEAFLERIAGYPEGRDRPGLPATSRLSPHLHWGEIGPRQVWHAITARGHAQGLDPACVEPFLRELGWREFANHLLYHYPDTASRPLRREYENFPWLTDPSLAAAWRQGATGYPLVDAGMRELWRTGWMHNRVRMVAASFLVKHLLQPWQLGAAWFWDTLVDADLANNSAGWQWVAGCGADAAPYFRIFNPVAQGSRLDPDGTYVRRWLPELARLPTQLIHRPWIGKPADLAAAGVRLGDDYPTPIVDHAPARARALEAFRSMTVRRPGGRSRGLQ